MKIRLQRVHYMPKDLEPGVLYVSEEFGAAAHLCPCGCGLKVRTPLGPTDWTLKETESGPTLYPSIGNWQFPCKSHYIIREGRIVWCTEWTPDQIVSGRRAELERARAFYESRDHSLIQRLRNFWRWLKRLLRK
jgi:hypothetical protein